MKWESTGGLAFWAPLALPLLLGAMAGFVGLVDDFSETGTVVLADSRKRVVSQDDLQGLLWTDLLRLWDESVEGVSFSLFAVHIWALSTLFTMRDRTLSTAVFYYPILGLLAHFILLTVVVSASELEGAFREASRQSAMFLTTFRDAPAAWDQAQWTARTVATIAMLLAFGVAWTVRKGVWHHCDSMTGQSTAPKGEPVVGEATQVVPEEHTD